MLISCTNSGISVLVSYVGILGFTTKNKMKIMVSLICIKCIYSSFIIFFN